MEEAATQPLTSTNMEDDRSSDSESEYGSHQSHDEDVSSSQSSEESSSSDGEDETSSGSESQRAPITMASGSSFTDVARELTPNQLRSFYDKLSGLTHQDVEKAIAEAGTTDVDLQAKSVMRKWLQINGRAATRGAILDALNRCRYSTAVGNLKEKWHIGTTSINRDHRETEEPHQSFPTSDRRYRDGVPTTSSTTFNMGSQSVSGHGQQTNIGGNQIINQTMPHPRVKRMVWDAVAALKEKDGSSAQSITKYVVANVNPRYDTNNVQPSINKALLSLVKKNQIVYGPGGSYRLGQQNPGTTRKKTKEAKRKKSNKASKKKSCAKGKSEHKKAAKQKKKSKTKKPQKSRQKAPAVSSKKVPPKTTQKRQMSTKPKKATPKPQKPRQKAPAAPRKKSQPKKRAPPKKKSAPKRNAPKRAAGKKTKSKRR